MTAPTKVTLDGVQWIQDRHGDWRHVDDFRMVARGLLATALARLAVLEAEKLALAGQLNACSKDVRDAANQVQELRGFLEEAGEKWAMATAEIERLRALVQDAYIEGSEDREGENWLTSDACAALGGPAAAPANSAAGTAEMLAGTVKSDVPPTCTVAGIPVVTRESCPVDALIIEQDRKPVASIWPLSGTTRPFVGTVSSANQRVPGESCPQWHNRPSVNPFEDLAHCGWCDELLTGPGGIVKAPAQEGEANG